MELFDVTVVLVDLVVDRSVEVEGFEEAAVVITNVVGLVFVPTILDKTES